MQIQFCQLSLEIHRPQPCIYTAAAYTIDAAEAFSTAVATTAAFYAAKAKQRIGTGSRSRMDHVPVPLLLLKLPLANR